MPPEGPPRGISWRRIWDEAALDLVVRTAILLPVGAYLVGMFSGIIGYDADLVRWPVLIFMWLLMAGHLILRLRDSSPD